MLIDWILKNIMDMDQEDQSEKTQWTKYYLTVYFSGLFNFLMILILSVFIWDVKRNLYCIRRTDFFTACRRWLACKTKWLCRLESIVIYVAIPLY